MRKRIVLSSIGPDQPGIVAAVASILSRYQANIEDTTMTRLASDFAVIMIVSLPQEQSVEVLQQDIKQLEQTHALSVLTHPIPEESEETGKNKMPSAPYMISVAGHDRTGITFHIAQKLADLQVNITDLSAQTIQGEEGLVYIMMVEVEVPSSLDAGMVEKALKSVAEDIGMEVQMRPLDTLAL